MASLLPQAHGPGGSSLFEDSGVAASPTPLVDVVACDAADTTPVIAACHALAAETRIHASMEAWIESCRNGAEPTAQQPADVAVLVGSADRLSGQGVLARATQVAADTRVLVAMTDASMDHAASVVNQGARGLIALPAVHERVVGGIREVVNAAARRQADRRASAIHRRGLATLTHAEIEVLDLMLAGLSNKQIADDLEIGLRTVELRRSKIMRKMAAKSVAQLISYVCLARVRCH